MEDAHRPKSSPNQRAIHTHHGAKHALHDEEEQGALPVLHALLVVADLEIDEPLQECEG
jgi:hypothetical protein